MSSFIWQVDRYRLCIDIECEIHHIGDKLRTHLSTYKFRRVGVCPLDGKNKQTVILHKRSLLLFFVCFCNTHEHNRFAFAVLLARRGGSQVEETVKNCGNILSIKAVSS